MTRSDTNRIEVVVDEERDRYHRQTLISWWEQDRLSTATVVVVGAGALGNEIVKNLVLMGIGHVIVVDMDRIENSNLSRCVFFREDDEGDLKAEVLCRRAQELNSEVRLSPITGDVRTSLGIGIFRDVDVVIGGLDNREARLHVNQACWKAGTPWVDGAIEGLMGVVRVFDPPDSACYECTMNEHDHALIAARRSCTLLSRGQMLEGKVPTNAPMASIVGGAQAQEAVKLLHRDELGTPTLAGAGYHFVGLTHDSYVVRYQRREDCLSHDRYELDNAVRVGRDTTFGEMLRAGQNLLGPNAILEFEQEVALSGRCHVCGARSEFNRPVDDLDIHQARCQRCDGTVELAFTHSVDGESDLIDRTPSDLGLPPYEVFVARTGEQRRFVLWGDFEDALSAEAVSR